MIFITGEKMRYLHQRMDSDEKYTHSNFLVALEHAKKKIKRKQGIERCTNKGDRADGLEKFIQEKAEAVDIQNGRDQEEDNV